MPSISILARNLRAVRQALRLTQEDFAHMAKSGRTYVGAIERAEENPTLDKLDAYARALGVETHELLNPDTDSLIRKALAARKSRG